MITAYQDKTAPHRAVSHATQHTGSYCAVRLWARAKITSHFRIPSSGHLRPIGNRKILEIGLLLLWFYDFQSVESDPNLGAKSVKLFLREP